MKETVKINLAQRLFDLDSDAYESLKNYLESLKQYFNKTMESTEDVLHDIEQRIAELLLDKLGDTKQVVTLNDVEGIINQMGTAEDFAREAEMEAEEDATTQENKSSFDDNSHRSNRKLFRDSEHKILGGVAAGLASYFNIDPIWMRLIFVALFFMNLFGVLLYAIMWAIVPEARTTAERLQMQGRPVNVENIQQSVKEEFGKVKDNLNKFSKSESYKNMQSGFQDVFEVFGKILLVFIKVILIIIGVGFAIAGLGMLVGLIGTFAVGSFWHGWNMPQLHFPDSLLPLFGNLTLLSIAVFVVLMVPIIAIVSAFMRVVFNLKKGNSVFSAFTWTLWALALVFVLVTFVSGHHRLGFEQKYTEKETISISDDQTLYITLHDKSFDYNNQNHYLIFGKDIIRERWGEEVYLEPEITILPSYSDEVYMEIVYSSIVPWENKKMPKFLVWAFQDTVLTIESHWEVDEDELWRMPRVNVLVYLPSDQHVRFDNSLRNIPAITDNKQLWPNWYYQQELVMKQGGLELVEK